MTDSTTPPVSGISFAAHPDLPGYLIGDDGSVWSKFTASGRIRPGWHRLSVRRSRRGKLHYQVIDLRHNHGRGRKTTRYVHRLVMESFLGRAPEGRQVRHIDGNPLNNRLSNLVWGTSAENQADKKRHGTQPCGSAIYCAKLDDQKVIEIRKLSKAGMSQGKLATKFSVSEGTIQAVVEGRTWRHLQAVQFLVTEGVF